MANMYELLGKAEEKVATHHEEHLKTLRLLAELKNGTKQLSDIEIMEMLDGGISWRLLTVAEKLVAAQRVAKEREAKGLDPQTGLPLSGEDKCKVGEPGEDYDEVQRILQDRIEQSGNTKMKF